MNKFILTSEYRFDKQWLLPHIKHLFNEKSRILVIAFAFYRDEEKDSNEFALKSGKNGLYTKPLIKQLLELGINNNQIDILNFYDDTSYQMKSKIKWANTIIFSGGNCELLYERIVAKGLLNDIVSFHGIICGASAGAMVLQKKYINFLDGDYVERLGFGILPDIGSIIVHNGKCLSVSQLEILSLAERFQTDLLVIGDDGAAIVDELGVRLVADATIIKRSSS